MNKEELLHTIALTQTEGIGDIRAKKLIAYCGSAVEVFKQSKKALTKIKGIGLVQAANIINKTNFKDYEKEVDYIEKKKIKVLHYKSEEYPQRLNHCNDAPVLLFYKGTANLNQTRIISVVGTRKISAYGKDSCEKIMEGLAAYSPLIVSGLAYGVDITAHRAALQNGMQTLGVIAHGMDRIYPSQHKKTATEMLEQGGLLTEHISGTNPDRENFPKRNRIVSGMCDAVLVIESKVSGGAMITATIANSYNRDVFAVPGRVDDAYSGGCNFLIKTNRAALVENADDIILSMQWDVEERKPKSSVQTNLFPTLSEQEMALYEFLKVNGKCSLDKICIELNLLSGKAAELLLTMELEGVVRSMPGKIFEAI
jgi:DNA processing protein